MLANRTLVKESASIAVTQVFCYLRRALEGGLNDFQNLMAN